MAFSCYGENNDFTDLEPSGFSVPLENEHREQEQPRAVHIQEPEEDHEKAPMAVLKSFLIFNGYKANTAEDQASL